jgi:putative membrane-bound dehydrogenase-like protein
MSHGKFWRAAAVFTLTLSISLDAADAPAPAPVNEAASSITVPDGFRVSLFAGEPNLVQPIAMTTDARGRLWIVECLSYPDWTTNKTGRDRVSIFEDQDRDGRFDKKTVFWDRGRNLSGIALGFGGVWLCSLPELIFIPDRDHDDKPDSEPEVLLDGWDLGSKHNVFNNLNWGPDGWLYGCNGILGNSYVAKPGTAKSERVAINCGVWKYHPTRREFEVVAHGTTNPWGIAFDEFGQMFVANCVIKHLFHIVPGARYERMFGQDFNPYAFGLIPSIADHIHWAGGFWKTEGAENPQNDVAGGGHAHSGAMIYLGEQWPEKYRNTFFTINIHGHRVNQDRLVRKGSGYVAEHAPDFLRVNDSWFRGVSIIPAQGGGAYVSDWSDAGECHDYEDIQRGNGRTFKVVYGRMTERSLDLQRLSDDELVKIHASKDEWVVTQVRLVLQGRAVSGKLEGETEGKLRNAFEQGRTAHARLRSLWALHAVGKSAAVTERALQDREEYVRAWMIQLALENTKSDAGPVSTLARMAQSDRSPVVRLYLASALQKMSAAERVQVASELVRHSEDSGDHNLPLLIWYGIEPVVASDEAAGLSLLKDAEIPLIRRFIARRLALKLSLNGLVKLLNGLNKPDLQSDVVDGLFAALNGRKRLTPPDGWNALSSKLRAHPRDEVRDKAIRLSLIFGDQTAVDKLWARALDASLKPATRVAEVEALSQSGIPNVLALLQQALGDPVLRLSAIKGLARFGDAKTPELILAGYRNWRSDEKAEAINTLSSRADYALALLRAVQGGHISARDLSPFSARQIEAYQDRRLDELLKELGAVREISKEKAVEVTQYKKLLSRASLEQANLSRGRVVFHRTCGGCHTLFDEGGKLAPELTGSQRTNLDYLLENIVDPSAVVWDRYQATYFETSDDQLISGVVLEENDSTVTIQTQTGTIKLPRADITSRKQSKLSIMPEGLFATLEKQEIIDLVAYLQSPSQVPLPDEK